MGAGYADEIGSCGQVFDVEDHQALSVAFQVADEHVASCQVCHRDMQHVGRQGVQGHNLHCGHPLGRIGRECKMEWRFHLSNAHFLSCNDIA